MDFVLVRGPSLRPQLEGFVQNRRCVAGCANGFSAVEVLECSRPRSDLHRSLMCPKVHKRTVAACLLLTVVRHMVVCDGTQRVTCSHSWRWLMEQVGLIDSTVL